MKNDKPVDKIVSAVFLRSADSGQSWEPIMSKDVPDWIKNNDHMMKEIIENNAQASNPQMGDNNWYMAVMPEKLARQVVIH